MNIRAHRNKDNWPGVVLTDEEKADRYDLLVDQLYAAFHCNVVNTKEMIAIATKHPRRYRLSITQEYGDHTPKLSCKDFIKSGLTYKDVDRKLKKFGDMFGVGRRIPFDPQVWMESVEINGIYEVTPIPGDDDADKPWYWLITIKSAD